MIKLKVSLVLIFVVATFAQHDHEIRTRFFNQPLDHFNRFDRRNWDQRFQENSEFFQEGGPIYIFISLGGPSAYETWIRYGLVHDLARDTNGLLIALEHRYYGASLPTPDASFENLQWLNIQQSLADIARFISHYRENNYGTENSQVILWGRGYGGSLAIWARQKYPHLIQGAWGSSATLNAVLEYPQFVVNMYNTIKQIGGDECGQVITDAMQMIEDAINAGNTTQLDETFRFCTEFDSGNFYDYSIFEYRIIRTTLLFLQTARYPEIDEKCTVIRGLDTPDDPPANALEGFGRWWRASYTENYCMNHTYIAGLELYSNSVWGSLTTRVGDRQNLWLQCTQFGIFPNTNGDISQQPYGRTFTMSFFRRWCADVFGNEIFQDRWWMEDSVGVTNELFGGLNPGTYRILMTQGELDPMRTLGPAASLNSQAQVITINLESFSRDLNSTDSVQDYPHLLEVKGQIRDQILQWLADDERPTPPPETTIPPIVPGI